MNDFNFKNLKATLHKKFLNLKLFTKFIAPLVTRTHIQMDSYKSNKKQWAQYLIALALHAQEAMANDTTTEDTVKTRSLKTDI